MYELLESKVKKIKENNEQDLVDYVGINIDTQKNVKYKIYYYEKCNSNKELDIKTPQIIKELKQKDLISVDIPVDDNNSKISRYELSIKAIEDEKILELIKILSKHTNLVKNNLNEILNLSKMEVFPNSNKHYASLYFLGLIQEDEQITATKFHFMTRREINYKTVYDNNYYLEYLKTINKEEMDILIKLATKMLENKIGNLHLMGVDYFTNKSNKYKIYFKLNNKNIQDIKNIIQNFQIENIRNILQELEEIEKFLIKIKSLKFSIIAICYDKQNGFSINLYFKIK